MGLFMRYIKFKLFSLMLVITIFAQSGSAYRFRFANATEDDIIIAHVVGLEAAKEQTVKKGETIEFNYPLGRIEYGYCTDFTPNNPWTVRSKFKVKQKDGTWTKFTEISSDNTPLTGLICHDLDLEITRNDAGDIRFIPKALSNP
jgi:hypothetical protein